VKRSRAKLQKQGRLGRRWGAVVLSLAQCDPLKCVVPHREEPCRVLIVGEGVVEQVTGSGVAQSQRRWPVPVLEEEVAGSCSGGGGGWFLFWRRRWSVPVLEEGLK